MAHTEAFLHQGKRRRSRLWVLIGGGVFGLLLIGGGLLSVQAVQAGLMAKTSVEAARAHIAEADWVQAQVELKDAHASLADAQGRLKPFVVLEPLPWVGTQVKALQEMLSESTELLGALDELVGIMARVQHDVQVVSTEESVDVTQLLTLTPAERLELVQGLSRAVPDLEQLQARVHHIREQLDKLSGKRLFIGLAFVRDQLVDGTRLADDALTLTIPFLEVLPRVGGFERPQHYLVLLQNTGELRPTGGFWGTYGVLRVEHGGVVDVVTDDIYAVDGPSEGLRSVIPPAPLQTYLGADVWYLRDANWSPDVPTSAARALTFWSEEVHVPAAADRPVTAPRAAFDGVILLTPEVGVELLRTLGDVQVRDLTFTPETFFDTLEYEVEQGFVDRGVLVEDRKDVIGEMVKVLLSRVQSADAATLGGLAEASRQLLANNDIVLYSQDASVQRVFEQQGWAGALRINVQHDHAMVVDANMAALKTDTQIRRSYTYSITKNIDGDLIANLQINYDHLGGFDYRTTRYRTYTRVYVPLGSQFIRAEGVLRDDVLKNPGGLPGTVDVSQEFGATVFGAFTSIEPQASGHLSFVYRLPDQVKQMVEEGRYVFDFQRQVGVGDAALTLDLNFGEPIKAASPAELSEYWFDDRYTYSTRAVPFQSFVVEF